MTELSSSSLREPIQTALKAGDKVRVSVLRLLSTALKNAEVQKMAALDADEAIQIVVREVKKRNEAAAEFEKGGRADRAADERAEADILRHWLPAQLSSEELEALVDAAVAESGATTKAETGSVMKILMPRVKGKADGKRVAELVANRLQ